MFDERVHGDGTPPPEAGEPQSLLDAIVVAGRVENRAAARRLTAVGALFELRRREHGEEADWAVDTWAAVGAEIAAALRVSVGKAGSLMHYGNALKRLPAVAAMFRAGDIDMAMFQTVVYRTDLIRDDAVMAHVDRAIAAVFKGWPSLSRGALTRHVDAIVRDADPNAERRTQERARDCDVTIWDGGDGVSDLSGRLLTTDAQVLDKRLDALAATVCEDDPRNAGRRRADALGALATGADRLMCRCGKRDCPAASATPTPVVIHVVAEQSVLEGRSAKPAYLIGSGGLISAELLRDIAEQAKVRPLITPGAGAESGYRPTRALADFVRARDLTCRAPGCDRPATECDLDHTVPHAAGGATHASNIKCLCRFHHLLKTFWGWKDRQLEDGTVIWTLPEGRAYVTLPGSALLFPSLMTPTGPAPALPPDGELPVVERTVMMPRRSKTRAQSRAHRIAAERSHNRKLREAAGALQSNLPDPPQLPGDDPPF